MTVSTPQAATKKQKAIITSEALTKIFRGIDSNVNHVVLKSVDLVVPEFSFVAILGPSGSGKTTLLNVLGGITPFQGGRLEVAGMLLNDMKETKKTSYWREKISFVYQFPENNVFMNLTVLENFILSGTMNLKKEPILTLVETCLKEVNLDFEQMKNQKAKLLSGGELQRLAIAIALMRKTPILLADEPTGELDAENTINIFELLKNITKNRISTCIAVSHDKTILNYCDKAYMLNNGILSELNI